jgi:hypothetical protein
VLAFEDLHWADPTSLDHMRALAERGESLGPSSLDPRRKPKFQYSTFPRLRCSTRVAICRRLYRLAKRHSGG